MIAARLVDVLGSDLAVANSLRRSFNTEHAEWSDVPRGPRTRSDRQLVEECAADGHDLAFRHCQATFACSAPIPVARQLGKHQVGFSWSETSRRYLARGIEFHRIAEWRSAPEDRRQGSGPPLRDDLQPWLCAIESKVIQVCEEAYADALRLGATPEQARFLLPQSMVVDWTWTGSLLGWATLYRRRTHGNVQTETQAFALLIAEALAPRFPVSWAALTKVR